ncbi:hypothetical protein H4Q26_016439 [Puccinia striiformis f. sp. tritici PST-130]|nr:hypothetical protein H4Q26_016439 [Puccinia striiformis f. sp. tritici PST-130]
MSKQEHGQAFPNFDPPFVNLNLAQFSKSRLHSCSSFHRPHHTFCLIRSHRTGCTAQLFISCGTADPSLDSDLDATRPEENHLVIEIGGEDPGHGCANEAPTTGHPVNRNLDHITCCIICLEEFEQPMDTPNYIHRCTECGRPYHLACCKQWLKDNGHCTTCKGLDKYAVDALGYVKPTPLEDVRAVEGRLFQGRTPIPGEIGTSPPSLYNTMVAISTTVLVGIVVLVMFIKILSIDNKKNSPLGMHIHIEGYRYCFSHFCIYSDRILSC